MKTLETMVPCAWRWTRTATQAVPALSDIIELMKARLTMMVLVTTAFGFWMGGAGRSMDVWLLLWTLLGTGLVAGGAAAMNEWMEADRDALMERTRARPLPQGRVSGVQAVWIAVGSSLAGLGLLWVGANLFAAGLALLTWVIYVLAYTPLKRCSSACTLVGGITGGLPPMIGWVAASGGLDVGAWLLFGILFLWQMPHFLAINWLYRSEYETAGFVMWSNGDESGRRTGWLSLLFLMLLLVLCVFSAWKTEGEEWRSVLAALACGGFLTTGFMFLCSPTRSRARQMFFASLIFLPVIMVILTLGAAS